ncbi:hypothetical protein LJK88_31085 [Paenibacillus sp. P26]|nr:hypothetical protein LJK88_31085 [Paenibacillus sp. P26]
MSMKFSIKHSMKWSIFISCMTFIMASVFTVTSTALLEGFPWGIGMLIVIFLIANGIFFDILGLAALAANETPFHAMASKNNTRLAAGHLHRTQRRPFLQFLQRRDRRHFGGHQRCGRGACRAEVAGRPAGRRESLRTVVSVVFTAMVSALTVGGKAMGKSFAIHYSTSIVLFIGKLFYFAEHRLGIRLFSTKRKKSTHGKRGNKHAARTNTTA